MIKVADLHAQWRALPVESIDRVVECGDCLVLAPHPDDESLGCGGLIAACCSAGRPPVVAILTDGSQSHPNSRAYPPARLAALRQSEVQAAVHELGLPADRLIFLGETDTKAPHQGKPFERVVARLAAWLAAFECSTIFVPWRYDPHSDHAAAATIGEAAARITAARLLAYPVWGWTLPHDASVPDHPVRGWRLGIQAHLPAKRRAIAAHASQYGQLIQDDPGGFQLPSALLQHFDQPWETFLLP